MKVMVLSANTGGGHLSCAGTIKEEFVSRGIPCEIFDALRCFSLPVDWLITSWHSITYLYFPKINRRLYSRGSARIESDGISPLLEMLFKTGAKALAKKIRSGNTDVVVCTHIFAAYMLTRAINDYGALVRSAFVSTDFSRECFLKYTVLDYYFVPAESIADEYILENIPRRKVISSGIPVAKDFYLQRKRKTDPTAGRKVLIAGGSMGCGPMEKMAFELAKRVSDDTKIVIVCGNNKTLYNSLKRKNKNSRIIICGYADNMAELMHSCDVFLTKPGGISLSEALASRTPTVLFDSAFGCESINYEFFTRHALAYTGATVNDAVEKVLALLESADKREKLIGNMSKISTEDSAVKIVDCLISDPKI